MKAYLIIYGYDEDYEIDSVFLDKEKAEAYAAANNQIPFDESNKFRIREVELNPPIHNKPIVEVHGYIDKNEKIQDLEIERIDRDGLERLENFINDNIDLYPGKLYGSKDVTFFDGTINVARCNDLTKSDEYIKSVIMDKR